MRILQKTHSLQSSPAGNTNLILYFINRKSHYPYLPNKTGDIIPALLKARLRVP